MPKTKELTIEEQAAKYRAEQNRKKLYDVKRKRKWRTEEALKAGRIPGKRGRPALKNNACKVEPQSPKVDSAISKKELIEIQSLKLENEVLKQVKIEINLTLV